jgi:hypothetical protein
MTLKSANSKLLGRLDIRPQVGMYGAFARLNYKAWFALAEYVDNSLQSYIANRSSLRKISGAKALKVRISIEPDRIAIEDNAAGISEADLPRAFSPAKPPPDASGLSEFGLGMKAASCWFARRWHVRTKALGESAERTIHFDVPDVVKNSVEHLAIKERLVPTDRHYTSVVLEDLNVRPQKRTIGKIRRHLSSIYRRYLEGEEFQLHLDGERLQFEQPPILLAPYFTDKSKNPKPIEWKKDIDIQLDSTHRVWGWAALRSKASISEAGFAVFRRNRLILGSHDDSFRPEEIFGKSNSYTYQRLFGELNVEGFGVSHTKDGIQWGSLEEQVIDELRKCINAKPLPLIDQAEGHRKTKAHHVGPGFGAGPLAKTVGLIGENAPGVIARQLDAGPYTKASGPTPKPKNAPLTETVQFDIEHKQRSWSITMDLISDDAVEDWYAYWEVPGTGRAGIKIQLNLAHPFSERFGLSRDDEEDLLPLIRIAAAMCIAEITALKGGASPSVRTVRRNFNMLLREALSDI